ncbi:hypothetical protein GCM10018954_044360 [Kutzneria kofuensis]
MAGAAVAVVNPATELSRAAVTAAAQHRVTRFIESPRSWCRVSVPSGSDGTDIGNEFDPAENRTRYVIGKSLAVTVLR